MWSYFEPEERIWYRWRLNGAEAWLRKDGDEWRLAAKAVRFSEAADEADGPEPAEPPEPDGAIVAVSRGSRVALRPLMPDRPYMIASRSDVRIHEGSEAVFRLDLPVMLSFQIEGGEILRDFMPFKLSNTWFGDKSAGSLCYCLPTALDPECRGESAACAGAEAPRRRSLARCEIFVRNAHKAVLHVEHLAVYTELLSLYDRDGYLETDRVAVEGQPDSGLKMSVVKRAADRRGELLVGARVGQSELMVRRGVGFLRAIAGM